MTDNPLEALRVILEHVREIGEQHGLTLEQFAVIPAAEEGGPAFAQALFGLDPDVAFKTLEERQTEAEFKDIMIRNVRELEKDKQQSIRDGGIDFLNKIKGLGEASTGLGLDEAAPEAVEAAPEAEPTLDYCPVCGYDLIPTGADDGSVGTDGVMCNNCDWGHPHEPPPEAQAV